MRHSRSTCNNSIIPTYCKYDKNSPICRFHLIMLILHLRTFWQPATNWTKIWLYSSWEKSRRVCNLNASSTGSKSSWAPTWSIYCVWRRCRISFSAKRRHSRRIPSTGGSASILHPQSTRDYITYYKVKTLSLSVLFFTNLLWLLQINWKTISRPRSTIWQPLHRTIGNPTRRCVTWPINCCSCALSMTICPIRLSIRWGIRGKRSRLDIQ